MAKPLQLSRSSHLWSVSSGLPLSLTETKKKKYSHLQWQSTLSPRSTFKEVRNQTASTRGNPAPPCTPLLLPWGKKGKGDWGRVFIKSLLWTRYSSMESSLQPCWQVLYHLPPKETEIKKLVQGHKATRKGNWDSNSDYMTPVIWRGNAPTQDPVICHFSNGDVCKTKSPDPGENHRAHWAPSVR